MLSRGPKETELLKAAATALFEVPVGVGATDPRLGDLSIYPSEVAHIAQARPARQREFSAGRKAARAAMADFDLPQAAVPMAPDRAPIWPAGVAGSITHSQSQCLAVVTRHAQSIGIDLEEARPLDQQLQSVICSPQELARIAGPKQDMLAKLIFCAKEAAYKAQYPLTKTLLGFDHFDVTLHLEKFAFEAIYQRPAGAFQAGDKLEGRFAQLADHFVTAVTIGPL